MFNSYEILFQQFMIAAPYAPAAGAGTAADGGEGKEMDFIIRMRIVLIV